MIALIVIATLMMQTNAQITNEGDCLDDANNSCSTKSDYDNPSCKRAQEVADCITKYVRQQCGKERVDEACGRLKAKMAAAPKLVDLDCTTTCSSPSQAISFTIVAFVVALFVTKCL